MTGAATRALKGLFKFAFAISILAVGLLALFVAWWIALAVVLIAIIYAGVHRLLRGKRPTPATRAPANVIDGEFRVEDGTQTTRHAIDLEPDRTVRKD
ncbi:MAG: hypothetical protein ACKVQK_14665 [Burkholderiales bacterium]